MEDFADLTAAQRSDISAAMCATFYGGVAEAVAAQNGLAEHVYTRYRIALRHVVPWISKRVPLEGARVVEIGCGTGSSTAAMARAGAQVAGYDIDGPAIEGARQRLAILGLSAELHHVRAEELLSSIREKDVDVVLLYAVLEHMTLAERLATIETSWRLLRPGGVLVVFDTPNRCFFVDYHTSLMPFFHSLPDPLARRVGERSPREDFRDALKSQSVDDVGLARWGRGVSYHEFETVLGDLEPLVVSDGFDSSIASLLPPSPLENLLREVFEAAAIKVPIGFSRGCVDVILRKPGPGLEPQRPTQPPTLLSRAVLAARLQAADSELRSAVEAHRQEVERREALEARLRAEVEAHRQEVARREALEGQLQAVARALRELESSFWFRGRNLARRLPGYEALRSAAWTVQNAVRARKDD